MNCEKNKYGYDNYEIEYSKITKECSKCKQNLNVRECFKLSPGMECGIHNICNDCCKKYGESMGDRLIKYRPDGNFTYKKTKKDQHDDHIMPLAYGGTNKEINHQLISENVSDIPLALMCERWKPILQEAITEKISITDFKSRISYAILKEQKKTYNSTDEEIESEFNEYKISNNRKINTKRSVEKFKTFCKNILKL